MILIFDVLLKHPPHTTNIGHKLITDTKDKNADNWIMVTGNYEFLLGTKDHTHCLPWKEGGPGLSFPTPMLFVVIKVGSRGGLTV